MELDNKQVGILMALIVLTALMLFAIKPFSFSGTAATNVVTSEGADMGGTDFVINNRAEVSCDEWSCTTMYGSGLEKSYMVCECME